MSSPIRDMAGPGAVTMGWGWDTSTTSPPQAHPLVGWLVRIVGYAGLTVSLIAVAGFFVFVNSIDRTERAPAAHSDAIVALTGGAQRVGDAIDLLEKGYGKRLLITGVNERTSREQIARLNPGQRRLFECCVDLDYRARNTIGNAIETRRWMQGNGFRSLIVVTSNYHMPRTLIELDHVLPGARKVPYAVVTGSVDLDGWWRNPGTAKFLAYEYVKLLAVYFRTLFETDPEGSAAANFLGGREPVKMVAEPLSRR
jgi:uncharacterized SAM-binding protein YcdF (DUF218 family)